MAENPGQPLEPVVVGITDRSAAEEWRNSNNNNNSSSSNSYNSGEDASSTRIVACTRGGRLSPYTHTSAEHSNGKEHHVIPGVEHVFFEQELEKMEHHQTEQDGYVIVLAVDNSGPSDLAFKFYVENVHRPGYNLHLVHHSNYWGNYEPMDGGPSPKHCEELMQKEDSRVEEIKAKYLKLMAEHNIPGEFTVTRGKDAWHDIIQYQEKVKAIMIVMGTRGQNTLRRTFMGSVSDSVVHHAACPVLVCCHPKH